MKVVYDNIIYALQRAGGISVVWSNLITRMVGRYADMRFLEYDNQNISRQTFTLPQQLTRRMSSSLLKLTRYLNPKLKEDKPFIFHSSYFRTCSHPKAINVTTVHDFTYELYVTNPVKRWLHCWQKHRAIRHSQHVVCISENTKKDLLRFLPDVSERNISVIYNGVSEAYHPLPHARKKDYILFVGNREGYKNFEAIIDPLAACNKKLVITGKPLTEKESILLSDARLAYEYSGMVEDAQLNRLYNEAFCLIYPSLYEGFGLPVIEAQQAGCPVIAHTGSSITEIIGDERMLISNCSTEEIKSRIDFLSIPANRDDVVRRGLENATRFSWDKMADSYDQLYRQLYVAVSGDQERSTSAGQTS